MRLVIIALFIGMTGCASMYVKTKTMPGPNGEKLYATQCNGVYVDISDCYKEAEKHCPQGWVKEDFRTEDRIINSGKILGHRTDRELLYKCK